ncbi:MAG: MerR family transcriptional regulator [Acidobacteria bacterium]|nr:MerR family transcriptional regulator [Acidobacteriota bacterium]
MGNAGFYTVPEAVRIAKVPRTTAGYWARTGLIEPSHRCGRRRLYSFGDLCDLVVCRQLKDQGANLRARGASVG